jgi:O-antigen/teichoic acid export membrane protein
VANDDVTTALITASLQIGCFALPIGAAAKGIMMPKIGDAVARKDRRAIRDIRRRYLATVLPPVVTIAVLVLVFEERILLYYSEDYLTADTPMKVALIGSIISSLLYIDTTIAQFTRNLRRSTVRSYALVAVGWIGLWFTGQTSATSIITVQMTLTLGCELITILQGRKAVRAWNREEASPSTS